MSLFLLSSFFLIALTLGWCRHMVVTLQSPSSLQSQQVSLNHQLLHLSAFPSECAGKYHPQISFLGNLVSWSQSHAHFFSLVTAFVSSSVLVFILWSVWCRWHNLFWYQNIFCTGFLWCSGGILMIRLLWNMRNHLSWTVSDVVDHQCQNTTHKHSLFWLCVTLKNSYSLDLNS